MPLVMGVVLLSAAGHQAVITVVTLNCIKYLVIVRRRICIKYLFFYKNDKVCELVNVYKN